MTCPHHDKNGAATAAILAAGIGCAMIGILTVLAEFSPNIKVALDWWPPAGPLTGKTGGGVIIWILSWGILHVLWHHRELPFFKTAWIASLMLILWGWLATFPPFYQIFAGH